MKYHTKAHDFQRHDDEEEKEVPRVKFHTKVRDFQRMMELIVETVWPSQLLRKVTSKRGGNAFDPLKPGALLLMAAIHHDDDEEEEEKDPSHPNVWERTVKFRTTVRDFQRMTGLIVETVSAVKERNFEIRRRGTGQTEGRGWECSFGCNFRLVIFFSSSSSPTCITSYHCQIPFNFFLSPS